MSSNRDSSRIEVGGGSLPIGPIAIALVIIAGLVLGVAYAGRIPFGSEVAASQDLEDAAKEYLAKNEKRFAGRMTFYNCAEFMDSILSGTQNLAAAVELGAMRPNATVAEAAETGNLLILKARKEKDGAWQIGSVQVPGRRYDPSFISADDPAHPCLIIKSPRDEPK